MDPTVKGTLIVLLIIFVIGFLSSAAMWLTATLQGWKQYLQFFNNFPSPLIRPNWSFQLIPRIALGIYSTGWYTPRSYGDGIPDPPRPGQFKAPTHQQRALQLGVEILWLFWGISYAISKDERRPSAGD